MGCVSVHRYLGTSFLPCRSYGLNENPSKWIIITTSARQTTCSLTAFLSSVEHRAKLLSEFRFHRNIRISSTPFIPIWVFSGWLEDGAVGQFTKIQSLLLLPPLQVFFPISYSLQAGYIFRNKKNYPVYILPNQEI